MDFNRWLGIVQIAITSFTRSTVQAAEIAKAISTQAITTEVTAAITPQKEIQEKTTLNITNAINTANKPRDDETELLKQIENNLYTYYNTMGEEPNDINNQSGETSYSTCPQSIQGNTNCTTTYITVLPDRSGTLEISHNYGSRKIFVITIAFRPDGTTKSINIRTEGIFKNPENNTYKRFIDLKPKKNDLKKQQEFDMVVSLLSTIEYAVYDVKINKT